MASVQGAESCFSDLKFQDMSFISTWFIHHVILFIFTTTPNFYILPFLHFIKWDLTYHQETELQAQ
jgi:hypothetical protein